MVAVVNVHDSKAAMLLMQVIKNLGSSTKTIIADDGYRGKLVESIRNTFGAYGKIDGNVTTGITFAKAIEAQGRGFYGIPYIEFHEITIVGEIKGRVVKISDEGQQKRTVK